MSHRALVGICFLLAAFLSVCAHAEVCFQGTVYAGTAPDAAQPVEGALVQLWAGYGIGTAGVLTPPDGWSMVAEQTTDATGEFFFSVRQVTPVFIYELRHSDFDGYFPAEAECQEPGTVISPSIIRYPGGPAFDTKRVHSGSRFLDLAVPEPAGALCLIVGLGGLVLRRRG